MEFDNRFTVALPPERAWLVLMDIERIAPCMPGAELTEKVDDRTYKGKVGVRLGPVALSFSGTAKFVDVNEAGRTAQVKANGTDAKGRGGANAVAGFHIEPDGAGSEVFVHTNLTLSGSVAQYGRGVGMIQEVSAELIRQFAANLQQMIAAEASAAPAPPSETMPEPSATQPISAPVAARPISGFALGLRVLWRMIRRLFASGSSAA